MRFSRGDMLACFEEADLFVVNGTGAVVEDAMQFPSQVSKAIADQFPGLRKAVWTQAVNTGQVTVRGLEYNLIVSPRWPVGKIAVLQCGFWRGFDLDIFMGSCVMLALWCIDHQDKQVAAEYPRHRPIQKQIDGIVFGFFKDFKNIHWYCHEGGRDE